MLVFIAATRRNRRRRESLSVPVSKEISPLKGRCVVFGEETQMQNFNIYNINEIIIQTQA